MSLKPEEIRSDQHPCIEVLPKAADYLDGNQTAIFQKNTIWPAGFNGRITITFGDRVCGQKPDCEAWSHIGKTCHTQDPAMNLGFIDPPLTSFSFKNLFPTDEKKYPIETYPLSMFRSEMRNFYEENESRWVPGATVVHEFCHSLGMLHEHQNNLFNSNTIKLNTNAVINYYVSGGMGRESAETNVIDRYSCEKGNCNVEGSRFDPESIMLYALRNDWVIGKNPTKPNFKLSATDKSWLRNEYPIDNVNMPILTYQFIDLNAPEWKQAWVIKTITDNLAPIVGIKFKFILSNGIHHDVESVYSQFPMTLNDKSAQPYETPVIKVRINPIPNRPLFEYIRRCIKKNCDLKKRTCVLECKTTKRPIKTRTLIDGVDGVEEDTVTEDTVTEDTIIEDTEDMGIMSTMMSTIMNTTMPSVMPSTMPSVPDIMEKFSNVFGNDYGVLSTSRSTSKPSKTNMVFYFILLFLLIALFCYIAFDTSNKKYR